MEFTQITHERRSIKRYDAEATISDAQLTALFDQVVLTPSAFNLQHWRFVAVRDPKIKQAMQEAAWGQAQVGDSAVAILVAAKLNAHEDAPVIFDETPQAVQEQMLPMIASFYADKAQIQRDEAIRSASMAAMTLMYAAKDQGYESGPMIGFDPVAMSQTLELDGNHIPVMLIVLGKGEAANRPRAYRHPLQEVVKLDSFTGAGLGEN